MKRRHVIGLLVMMITICAFVAIGFAQPCDPTPDGQDPGSECPCDPTATHNCGDLDDITDAPLGCRECDKCEIGNVPCEGGQGGRIFQPFDYDGEPYPGDTDITVDNPGFDGPGGFGSHGYCTGFNFAQNPLRDCKFIMNVCRCPQACNVLPGSKVAIQMIIRTPGVYFAGRSDGNPVERIRFDLMGDKVEEEFCLKENGAPGKQVMKDGRYYYDANGNELAYGMNLNPPPPTRQEKVRYFPQVKYYTDIQETYVNGELRATPTGATVKVNNVDTPVVPLGGGLTTKLEEVNKAKVLMTDGQYMFNDYDASIVANGAECHIWIDIPPMRLNPDEYTEGDRVRITVRLVFNQEQGGICPTCNPPDYCECERDIAIICCNVGDVGCMYFPYVLQGLENTMGWTSGIAVSARQALPDNPTCTLTLTDQAGTVSTYTKSPMPKIWAFVLDNEMSNFNAALAPGAASLQVICNYSVDGYSFLNAQTFGAGTQPRGCGAGRCCP